MLRQVSNLGHLGKSGSCHCHPLPRCPWACHTDPDFQRGLCTGQRCRKSQVLGATPPQLTAHSANQSHPSNILNFAVSVCVAVQKEREIMYNPPVFCKWSLNEGQFSSQVVYLPSLTGVLLTRNQMWGQGTRELVLSSATSGFAMSERSSHCSLVYGTPLVKGHMIPQTNTFFVSVLLLILVNESFKPFFVPTLFVLHLRLHPWAPAASRAQVGLQFTQQGLNLSTWTRSNKLWPHCTEPAWGWSQRWLWSSFRLKCIIVIICSASFSRMAVIALYKHVHFWAPSQALKQQLWLVRWDRINHYWK